MDLHAAATVAAARPRRSTPRRSPAFQLTAAERPDAVALRNPGDADRDHLARVRRARRADRRAAWPRSGSSAATRSAIMLLNRPEFHLVDTAALHLGAVPFSVYNTCTARAGRVPVPQRRQPRRGHRAATSCDRAGRAGSCRRRARRRDRRRRRRHHEPRRARGHAARAASTSPRPGGGRARRPRDDHLHVGHDRAAEGRRAHPRQPDGRVRGCSAERCRRRPAAARCPSSRAPTSSTAGAATATARWPSASRSPRSATRARSISCCRACGRRAGAPSRAIWEKIEAALAGQGITDPAALPEEERADMRAEPRARRGRVAGRRRGADADRVAAVLRRRSACRSSELWGMSETVVLRDHQPAGRDPRSAPAARRSRASSIELAADGELLVRGPTRDARLPQRPGGDRGGDRRRRLAAHRRHRHDRRRRLHDDRRPQEGADHQRGRQEHVAGQHRAAARRRRTR